MKWPNSHGILPYVVFGSALFVLLIALHLSSPPDTPDIDDTKHLLTLSDHLQLELRGGPADAAVRQQIKEMREGAWTAALVRPCGVDDGILTLDMEDRRELARSAGDHFVKFVPAAGSATRLFQRFLQCRALLRRDPAAVPEREIMDVLAAAETFAFYALWDRALSDVGGFAAAVREKKFGVVLDRLLFEENGRGLGYAHMPKGLIPFHKYPDGEVRTPVEEHLIEAAQIGVGQNRRVHVHFCVSSSAHEEAFRIHVQHVSGQIEARFDVVLVVTFSQQKSDTDAVALDLDGAVVRDDTGALVLRPGGHGALLSNLQDVGSGGVLLIKNIDNVQREEDRALVVHWKRVLLGLLAREQRRIFAYIRSFEQDASVPVSDDLITEAMVYIKTTLGSSPRPTLAGQHRQERINDVLQRLRRPLRVAAMIPTDGNDTGGGPYWMRHADGSESVQVVETAQINLDDPDQRAIVARATYQHPADMVVSITMHTGAQYDVADFRDANASFVTRKSLNGMDIVAYEHPGLWNGGMANWNSIFVHVPRSTFTPVHSKKIN